MSVATSVSMDEDLSISVESDCMLSAASSSVLSAATSSTSICVETALEPFPGLFGRESMKETKKRARGGSISLVCTVVLLVLRGILFFCAKVRGK